MADQDFDVVVIGAGPAGSSAAKRACDLGLSVALIDRAVFPRPKLCGALISPRGNKAVKRVFDMEMSPEMFLVSRQVAFKWDGEELNRFDAPYDLTYTYRLDFDHWLQQAAVAAGAVDMQGTRVETIHDADNLLELSDGRRIGYKVLIGADGAASPVAKHILGAAYDPDKIGFAFETEAPGGCEPEALMSIDFDIVHWGYGWNFPKAGSRTIGLGAIRSVDQDLQERMARYLAHEGVDPDSVKIKGAHIPLGDFKEKPGKGNVLLAGDAAGFVDGITGEGIALAIESGAEAAEAAAQPCTSAASGAAPRDRASVKAPTKLSPAPTLDFTGTSMVLACQRPCVVARTDPSAPSASTTTSAIPPTIREWAKSATSSRVTSLRPASSALSAPSSLST